MSDRDSKRKLEWEKRRNGGRVKFIVKSTIYIWLVVGILGQLLDYYYMAPGRSAFDGNSLSIFFLLVVDPAVSFGIACWDWERNERWYNNSN